MASDSSKPGGMNTPGSSKHPEPPDSAMFISPGPGSPDFSQDTGMDVTEDALEAFLDQKKLASIARQAETVRGSTVAHSGAAIDHFPEDVSSDDDDQQATNFRKMKQRILEKEATGTLKIEEEIQFRRMEHEENRRRANRAPNDDEAQPAVGDGSDPYIEGQLRSPGSDGEASDGQSILPGSTKRKAKSDARKSKKRARKDDSKGKNSKSALKPRQSRKRELEERQRQANLLNANSIGNQSLFHDVLTNSARAEQPGFRARRKDDAFKELIASIPEDSRSTATVDMNQLKVACKKFTGQGSCYTASNGEWQVRGMVSTLTHYQMLGVSHMRERETTPDSRPAGGLHADAMGLGKTVMAIANIVNDRWQFRKDKGDKAPTLIVAPSSIIPQWKEECEKHAEEKALGKVLIYRPGIEIDDANFPYNYGVILTSYQQVMKSFPKKDPPVELVSATEKAAWWNEYYAEHKGFFHRVGWRRVVLDEATAIKNYQSQTAIACTELQAEFRWALTGTPAMNALDEFYAYFRFLRTSQIGSFQLFRRNFLSDESNGRTGRERLVAFMRPFMIRRTHGDSILGAKLLNLPTPSRNTFRCIFSKLHSELYNVVRRRFIEKINIISKRGELRKQYTCILTLLLRLRQLTGHPLLIQDTMRDLLEPADFDKIQEILDNTEAAQGTDQATLIIHLRRMMTEKEQLAMLDNASSPSPAREAAAAVPATPSEPAQAPAMNKVGGSFGKKDDFAGFMQELRQENKDNVPVPLAICVKCEQEAHPPIKTNCGHTYCESCTMSDTVDAIERGERLNRCAECRQPYSTTHRYEMENITPMQAKDLEHNGAAPKFFNSADGKARVERPKTNINEIINTWIAKDGKMLPSAKTLAIKAQILNWRQEEPDCKIIIYTQFNTMLNIVYRICHLEGWSALKYNGSMSPQSRAKAVKKFTNDPSIGILISSLRCGGLGLNLTMATRVLLVDPWWNVAVEEQAFCRTYRRGQTQPTRMTRLVVVDTVDEHMITLQDRKIGEIESVMGDESRNKTLPIKNLLQLFGPVGHDADGNQFVYTDESADARGVSRVYGSGDEDDVMGDSL